MYLFCNLRTHPIPRVKGQQKTEKTHLTCIWHTNANKLATACNRIKKIGPILASHYYFACIRGGINYPFYQPLIVLTNFVNIIENNNWNQQISVLGRFQKKWDYRKQHCRWCKYTFEVLCCSYLSDFMLIWHFICQSCQSISSMLGLSPHIEFNVVITWWQWDKNGRRCRSLPKSGEPVPT